MTSKGSLANRLRHELREYAIVAVYLYVCFGVLLLYKDAILREEGLSYLHFGLAAGKALILGKFILLGETAGVGTRVQARNLLIHIARKIALFLVFLIMLSVLEEFVVGLIHGRTMGDVAADFESRSMLALTATCLYMVLVLTPYIGVRELSRALGPGALRAALFAPPGRAADVPQHKTDHG